MSAPTSGLWVDYQRRYDMPFYSDRPSLIRAFQRAGWRTVGVHPGVTEQWASAAGWPGGTGRGGVSGDRPVRLGWRRGWPSGPAGLEAAIALHVTNSVLQFLELLDTPRATVHYPFQIHAPAEKHCPLPAVSD